MTQKQFTFSAYTFRPSLAGTIALIICVPLFIKLGLWQYNKAMLKQEIKTSYDLALHSEALNLPEQFDDLDSWRYKKIKTQGHYETTYQILLDNQVENSTAGFHVLTPLKIEGSKHYVLINRGWIAGGATHTDLPNISTPNSLVEITGLVWVPSTKIFSLENKAEKNTWNQVWQHMDMERYSKSVPIPLLPVVIKLDSASNAGGFIRNWPLPASQVTSNLGYAYQWFGFAIASILIYLYTSVVKAGKHS